VTCACVRMCVCKYGYLIMPLIYVSVHMIFSLRVSGMENKNVASCIVLHCVAMCWNLFQSVAMQHRSNAFLDHLRFQSAKCSMLYCVALWCSVLQRVAACCSVWSCFAECCRVLQSVASVCMFLLTRLTTCARLWSGRYLVFLIVTSLKMGWR